MKIRRRKTESLNEPPAVLLVDIAFNLLIFFVVCASTEPQEGRKQEIPGSQQKAEKSQQAENIEVSLTRTTVALNGMFVKEPEFVSKLTALLADKKQVEDRIVLVKSMPDTTYSHWIHVTELIEKSGGVTTLQLEEQREVQVK